MASSIDPDPLARAEAALAALARDYPTWAEADIAALEAALAGGDRDRMFAIAHDIKGQAGTFGYPLLSDLAARLCRLLQTDGAEGAGSLVAAMAEVVRDRLAGDGGERGREMVAGLEA